MKLIIGNLLLTLLVFLSLSGISPEAASDNSFRKGVIVLPLQSTADLQAESEYIGIAAQNIIENLLALHGGIEESWAAWYQMQLFPDQASYRSWLHGKASIPAGIKDIDLRYIITGTVKAQKDNLLADIKLIDRASGQVLTKVIALDFPGLENFRKDFISLLDQAGIPASEQQKAKMLWKENLPLSTFVIMGKGLFEYFFASANEKDLADNNVKTFKTGLSLSRDSYLLLNNLGWGLYAQGKYAESKQFFEQALAVNQVGVDAADGLMWCGAKKGDIKLAEEMALKKSQIQGKNPKLILAALYNRLGGIAFESQDYTAAITHLRKAIELDESGWVLCINLSRAYKEIEKYDEAQIVLEEALQKFVGELAQKQLRNELAGLYNIRGEVSYNKKDYKVSILYIRKALELSPNSLKFAINLSIVHRDAGMLDEAEKILNEADRKFTQESDQAILRKYLALVVNRRGMLAFQRKDYLKSIEHFQRALALDADNASIIANLAFAYIEAGKFAETEALLTASLQKFTSKESQKMLKLALDEMHLGLVNKFSKNKEYEKALEHSQAAYEIEKVYKPGNIVYRLNDLGMVYDRLKRYDKAIEYYEQALEMSRQSNNKDLERRIRNNLGFAYDGLKLYDKAIENFDKALTIERGMKNQLRKDSPKEPLGSLRLMVQLGQPGGIDSGAFSPDGRFALTGGPDNQVCLWEMETGRQLWSSEQHAWSVNSVAFSPDGRFILTANGNWDGNSRLWRSGGSSSFAKRLIVGDRPWERIDSVACLRELATGEEIHHFLGHSAMVTSVAFSPDSSSILTGSADKTARIYDTKSRYVICILEGHTDIVTSVAFSPDGRTVLTGSKDKTGRLWDAATGKVLKVLNHADKVDLVKFSADGKQAFTREGRNICIWDLTRGLKLECFDNKKNKGSAAAISSDGRLILLTSNVGAVLYDRAAKKEIKLSEAETDDNRATTFSPDGRYLMVASGYTAGLWDVAARKEIHRLSSNLVSLSSVAASSNGRFILTGAGSGEIRLWNLSSNEVIELKPERTGKDISGLDKVIFSPDNSFAVASFGSFISVIDIATGKQVRSFEGESENRDSVVFSPGGRYALIKQHPRDPALPGTTLVWETATGNSVREFTGSVLALSPDSKFILNSPRRDGIFLSDALTERQIVKINTNMGVGAVAFSPDSRYVIVADQDGPSYLYDAVKGEQVRTFEGHPDAVVAVAFSPDGRFIVTGSNDKTARLWDVQTGQEVHRFEGHLDGVTDVAFSADGRFILTSSNDSITRIWDVSTGQITCRLLSSPGGTWTVVDSEARYDAPGGEVEGLHWVVGTETIAFSQLKDRYYEPYLLSKLLGHNKNPLRSVSAFKEIKLFPSIEYNAPGTGSSKISISLTNRGGGIGKVQVKINGKEIIEDARGPHTDPNAASLTLDVNLDLDYVVPGEVNDIEVVAWNAEGYLSSPDERRAWVPQGDIPRQGPELYAIVIGISDYSSPLLKLRFAAKDAEDMARGLEVGAKRLFGADKVNLTTLVTNDNPSLAPSKENIRKAFEAARSARRKDIFVVYLAGHGVSVNAQTDLYCYLTQEARTTNLSDPAIREQTSITSEELTEWIKNIPAGKQVMILDTCAAGAAAAKLAEKRNTPGEQIRAMERLKDRTGFHILMGSAADSVSYEASQYGQGLLTYALLQGMRGAALRDDEYIDISKLFQYAVDQVPQLAQNIGGIQRPNIAAPRGTSFDIGQLNQEDKKLIPLALVKPMVLRPTFFNPKENYDNFNLSQEVAKKLRQESYVIARSETKKISFVYVDAEDMPGAIRPSGSYILQGGTMKVNIVLIRDHQKISNFQIGGVSKNLSELVDKIVDRIREELKHF